MDIKLKNIAIRKYLVRVLIYTIVFVPLVIFLDELVDGARDVLLELFPYYLFEFVWENKVATMLFFYSMGLLLLSVLYLFRLARLLNKASSAIVDDTILADGEKCPEELKDFSLKLSEFKRMAAANEQARKYAEQQKNDLIVYLAHDLKTPLTSIIGYLSLLDEQPEIPTKQRAKYTGIALDKAYRLEQLINEFFDITRLNLQSAPTFMEQTNITVLLLQVINEFYPMLESKNMSINPQIASDLKVMGDSEKLSRAFENLLKNAVNYGLADSTIQCVAYTQGNSVIIKLCNLGETIPPQKLERLFDKFYRLDTARGSQTGGTGLGLAITKQIIELHGGTVKAASQNGVIEFTVLLPL